MSVETHIHDISGSSTIQIISGLIGVTSFVQENSVSTSQMNKIYQAICPKLKHNNYKIRMMSFGLVEYILENSFNYLQNPIEALPGLLFGLVAANDQIPSSSKFSIKILIHNIDIKAWWPEYSKMLTTTRSKSARNTLLKMLLSFPNRIPLKPIVGFLEDSDLNTKTYAQQIFIASSKAKAIAAMTSAKLSFSTYNYIIEQINIQNHIEETRVAEQEHKQVNMRNLFRHQNDEDSDESVLIQRAKKREKEYLAEVMTESVAGGSDQESIKTASSKNSKESKYNLSPESDKLSKHDNDDSNFLPESNSAYEEEENEEEEIISKYPSEKSETAESEKVDPKTLQTVGVIKQRPAKKLKVQLRDLSNFSWFERLTFYQLLENYLNEGNGLSLKGRELFKCILSGAFPIHQKTCGIVLSCLNFAIMYHPQYLPQYLYEIVKYIIFVINDFGSKCKQEIDSFMDVILEEASIPSIIDASINIEAEKKRSLHVQEIILGLLKRDPELILPKRTLFNLLNLLLNDIRNPSSAEILKIVSERQLEEVLRFYHLQPPPTQRVLRQYIKKPSQPRSRPLVPKEEPSPTVDFISKKLDPEALTEIIESEVSKQSKNIQRFYNAFQQLEFDDLDHLIRAFLLYIEYISTFDDDVYQSIKGMFLEIARKHFRTPKVLQNLNISGLQPTQIKGLARFVWNCPVSALEGSDTIYHTLYGLFCGAPSAVKLDIVQITLSIQMATGVAWTDRVKIKNTHRILIRKLSEQFDMSI